MTIGLAPLAEEPRRESSARAILSWVAAVGDVDPNERCERLPLRRTVLAPPGQGNGLQVLGIAGLPLPQSAALGRCGVVFEGELYDRDELLHGLGRERESSCSDAELVAHAYLRWGEGMLAHLEGLFAFAVWDERSQRLLAARDRMGIYPLFYSHTGRERVFATSPALLTLHPRVSRRLHRAVMAERLCYRFHDARETDYAQILRLTPGHFVLWTAQEERQVRYWNPVPDESRDWIRDDVPARVDALMHRAITRSLDPDPPGIFLSGGLDSINVAAQTTDICRTRGRALPLALSVAFPGKLSEASIQSGVARQLGLEHVLLPFEEISGGDRALLGLTELSPEFPLPLLSQWKTSYLRLADEGVRRGCRTILNGIGGDEWMDMGVRAAADLLRGGDVRGLYALWRTLDRCYPRPGIRLARYVLWQYGARPLVVAAALSALGAWGRRRVVASKRRYIARSTPTWLAPDAALRRELDERAERYFPDPPRRDFLGDATRQSLDSGMNALQFEEMFETGRRVGARLLSPLLDTDLVELLIRVPREILHRGGMTKALLRDPAVRRFPDLGFDRQRKLGATPFARSFLKEQAYGTLTAMGGLRRLEELEIVAAKRFEHWAVEDLAKEKSLDNIRIWYSLSLESWVRARE